MALTLTDFVHRLVPISDFSKGKAGQIFTDVEKNNNEYVILRNNQPTAVLVSIHNYEEMQKAMRNAKYLTELDKRSERLARGEGIHKTMEELRAMEDE